MDANAATQPAASDEDLAKVLADIDGKQPAAADMAGLQFEETPAPGQPPADQSASAPEPPAPPAPPEPPAPAPSEPAQAAPSDLENLKRSALEELRPLATRLNLPAKEKFDILLLIIRSTDDQSLLEAAHEAARSIEDENLRAEALLDIIKEIDYFAGNQQ